MSSGSERGEPTGVIRQGNRVVGGIIMPEDEELFMREFNHCYGQLRMSVTPIAKPPAKKPVTNDPHTFQIPSWFRHVWHSTHPREGEESNGQ